MNILIRQPKVDLGGFSQISMDVQVIPAKGEFVSAFDGTTAVNGVVKLVSHQIQGNTHIIVVELE